MTKKVIFFRHSEEATMRALINLVEIASESPKDELTPNEQAALDEASQEVGAWCAEIVGHFDFAEMNDEQRGEFLRRIILGYRRHLRAIVDTAPPF